MPGKYICPLSMINSSVNEKDCLLSRCMWYDGIKSECAVLALSRNLEKIAEKLPALTGGSESPQ